MFHSDATFICNLSIPACSHRLSRATMDCRPYGSTLLSWCAKSNISPHSFLDTHSCLFYSSHQNLHYPVQAPPTSHFNWSGKTPSQHKSGIKILELTPLGLEIHKPFTPLLLPTLLPTRWSVSASIIVTISSFQADLETGITNINLEWKTVWEVFPEVSENPIGNI